MARSGGFAAGGQTVAQLQQPAPQPRPHLHQQQQQPQQHVTVALLATAIRPPARNIIGRARSFHGFRRDDSSDGEDTSVDAESSFDLHHMRPATSSSFVASAVVAKDQLICTPPSSLLKSTLRSVGGSSSSRQQAILAMAHHRPPITARQIEIVDKQWNAIRHHVDTLGCEIFVKLFSTYPSIQTAWRPFRDRSPQDERFRETLRNHGINVLNVIGRFLQAKDNLDAGIDLLHELGQRHVTYDAKMVFADVVVQQFLFTVKPLLADDWTDESEQAWSDFFKFVVHVMRECTML